MHRHKTTGITYYHFIGSMLRIARGIISDPTISISEALLLLYKDIVSFKAWESCSKMCLSSSFLFQFIQSHRLSRFP